MAVGAAQQREGEERTPQFFIYTDGACSGNPGPGGSGIYIQGSRTGQVTCRGYGIGHTTNQRAELLAVVIALEMTPVESSVELRTDSRYVVRGFDRLDQYRKSNWRRRTRSGLRRLHHRDLWQRLHKLLARRSVSVIWVSRDGGLPEQLWAHTLASQSAYWAKYSSRAQADRTTPFMIIDRLGPPPTAPFVPLEELGEEDAGPAKFAPPSEGDIHSEVYSRRWAEPQPLWARPSGYKAFRYPARLLKRVDAHQGTHHDFAYRYCRAAVRAALDLLKGGPSDETVAFCSRLFEYISDYKMLRIAFDRSERNGSLAAGVDGKTFADYDDEGRNELLRELSGQLRDGAYEPDRLRRVKIPKPGGRGKRPIDVPSVRDRVVETALNLGLTPLLDQLMHPHSVGFRPGRSVQEGLARAVCYATNGGLWIMAGLDMTRAFTSVPKKRLMNVLDMYVANRKVADLIRRVVERPLPQGLGIRKGRGLPQGGPVSPVLLNLYLTHHLDHRWAEEHPDIPLLRYVDDLVLLCKEPGQAVEMVKKLGSLLQPHGMNFRDQAVIADLCDKGQIDFWGYRLSRSDGALRIEIPQEVWKERAEDLRRYLDKGLPRQSGRGVEEHRFPLTDEVVSLAVHGWLGHAGPAFPGRGPENRTERYSLLSGIREALHRVGIDPVIPADEMHRVWRTAYDRWHHLLGRVNMGMQFAAVSSPQGCRVASPPAISTQGWALAVRQVIAAGKKRAG